MSSVVVKVDGEKVKWNGLPVLATGGTCALIGRLIAGIAPAFLLKAHRQSRPSIAFKLISALVISLRKYLPSNDRTLR